MYVSILLHVCLCTVCMPGVVETRRELWPQELEYQVGVSLQVSARNQTLILCENNYS